MKMRKFGDWLLGVVMFRGPIATGIGVILEVFFYCIAAFLFGNAKWYQDFTDNHTIRMMTNTTDMQTKFCIHQMEYTQMVCIQRSWTL